MERKFATIEDENEEPSEKQYSNITVERDKPQEQKNLREIQHQKRRSVIKNYPKLEVRCEGGIKTPQIGNGRTRAN